MDWMLNLFKAFAAAAATTTNNPKATKQPVLKRWEIKSIPITDSLAPMHYAFKRPII